MANLCEDAFSYGGIDIGSTTVKLVVLDKDYRIVYGNYRRHHDKLLSSEC